MYEENSDVMSANIQKYLKRLNMSQTVLAEKLGINRTSVHHWVSGRSYPRIDKIEQMASIFGCTKADLVENESQLTRTYELTNEEYALLQGYRIADNDTKRMVLRILMALQPSRNMMYDMNVRSNGEDFLVEPLRRKDEEP